jgi:hypothetical protein
MMAITPLLAKYSDIRKLMESRPVCWLLTISCIVERSTTKASLGITSSRVSMIFSSRPEIGMYGINVKRNRTAGTKAIINEYEIELARREIELFFIPLKKNTPTSYSATPLNPGRTIFLEISIRGNKISRKSLVVMTLIFSVIRSINSFI